MGDEVLRRAARVITDLRSLADSLREAGYPGSSVHLQGFAGFVKCLEGELLDAQAQKDAKGERATGNRAKRAS